LIPQPNAQNNISSTQKSELQINRQCYNSSCGANRNFFDHSEVVHVVRTPQCTTTHQISSLSHWHTYVKTYYHIHIY